ncbi:hypothetical protein D3C72_751480 [compost metagenome]
MGRDRRGFRQLDQPPRRDLPAPAQYSGRLGHGRQRSGHGLRQSRLVLGNGRRLHPQPFDGRGGALRRIPRQCSRGGRGGGHPHAAIHHRSRTSCLRLRQAFDGKADAGGFRRIPGDLQAAGKPLSRHAGSGIHHRARQALDAADPFRQAYHPCRHEDRRRYGRRRVDLAGGSRLPHRALIARPAASPHHRSRHVPPHHWLRPAGLAGGGDG